MSCPLCKSESEQLIEKILKNDLVMLYKEKYNFDVSKYIKSEIVEYKMCKNCHLYFFFPYSGGGEDFYEYFQKYDWYYEDEKNEFNFAASFVRNNDKVLEIGSGKGMFAKKIPTTNYVGLEFSKTACDLAEQNKVKILNEIVEHHALEHAKNYDVVCSFQVLEHVENVDSFLRASIECLKPAGRLIISVPSEDSFLKYMVNSYLNLPPHHATRWSDHALQFIAKKFNLEIETIYHEKLQTMHEAYFLRTFIENAVRDIFHLKFKMVNLSIIQKMVKVFSFISAKFLVKGFEDEMKPFGHSIIVVYKKL